MVFSMSEYYENLVQENFRKVLGDAPLSTLRFEECYNPVYRLTFVFSKRTRIQELLRNAIDVFISTRTSGAALTTLEKKRLRALKDTCLAYNNIANAVGLLTMPQLLNERLGYDVDLSPPVQPPRLAAVHQRDEYDSN